MNMFCRLSKITVCLLQALIGSTERSLNGSKAEVDSSRQASRGTAVVSSRAVKGTVSELAAKFECSQTLEPKHDVEKVFPIAHKERTANHIQVLLSSISFPL